MGVGGCPTCSDNTITWSTTKRVHDNHYIGGIQSQLKVGYCENELQHESDRELREYLEYGVKQGFRIVDKDVSVPNYFCKNYNSVLNQDSGKYINDLLRQEIDQGKILVTDHQPKCVHALGAIKKKGGGYRPITDCKRPLSLSINNFMEETFQTFTYQSSDNVCNLMSRNCYMATIDISGAYRSVSIHPSDWEHQGLSWVLDGERCFLLDTRISFGLRCAPFVFTRIGEFISNCMKRKGYDIVHYIDDFWVQGKTRQQCEQAQMELIVMLGRFGFSIAWEKCSAPSRVCTYLGLEFDSSKMTVSLPQQKIKKLHEELNFFTQKKRATKKQIMRLAGVLSHSARVIRGGRTFSRRILDLLKGLPEGNPRFILRTNFNWTFNGGKIAQSSLMAHAIYLNSIMVRDNTFAQTRRFKNMGSYTTMTG